MMTDCVSNLLSLQASRLSYYSPEDISSNPASPTPYAPQQQNYRAPPESRRYSLQGAAYDGSVPDIAIQRASQDTSRGNIPYQPYGGAANSRTALHNASTDSFNAEFESAFGSGSNDGAYKAPPQQPSPRVLSVETSKASALIDDEETSTPTVGPNFHDRFKLNSPPRSNHNNNNGSEVLDTFEPTPTQPNFGNVQSMGLGPMRDPHNRDASGMSDYSYHTAGGSESGNANDNSQWR